ncbi:MAG: PrgI family protein [Thiobacillus sp.]
MAVYKVPQDVEADDKLIGPFSFRQFVYLMIVAAFIALAWAFAQIFVPLIIICIPPILFFGALALPLRKDQPMEIYMAAIVSYYLKPRNRVWEADGVESLIEVTAPKTVEIQRTKALSQTEAEQRLSYLAQIVDTRGWAVRGSGVQPPNSAMNTDVYFEAQQVDDLLDENNSTSIAFAQRLSISDQQHHQELVDALKNPKTVAAILDSPSAHIEKVDTKARTGDSESRLEYNPYPTEMRQTIIEPMSEKKAKTKPDQKPSEKAVSPDIINLANNTDLTIATIAREANRIHEKQDLDEEVIISLR